MAAISSQYLTIYKLIVILAGYEHDINNLMASNSGLSSRFPEEIIFYNLEPDDCLDVLRRQLEKEDIRWDRLSDKVSVAYAELKDDIEAMAGMPSWGNARDIGTIAQSLTRLAYTQGTASGVKPVVLDDAAAIACLRDFATSRRSRAANLPRPDQRRQPDSSMPMATASASAPPPPPSKTQTSTATKKNSKPPSRPKPPPAKVK